MTVCTADVSFSTSAPSAACRAVSASCTLSVVPFARTAFAASSASL